MAFFLKATSGWNPRGASVRCVIIFMHFCLCISQAICLILDFFCIQTLISNHGIIESVKINLPLLQQDYGDGDTIFEWGLFCKKLKP